MLARWLLERFDRSAARAAARARFRAAFPRAGFEQGRVAAPLIDRLTDGELDRLNALLDWNCFTADVHGRRFGCPAKEGKRESPQPIPDPRIVQFDERFGLAGKRVLEIGCFEGIHTIALCQRAASVVAIDARVENVVKTIVRCALFGVHPTVFPWDVESSAPPPPELSADLAHHVGVLYHLRDPVAHLVALGKLVRDGLMLDTSIAAPEQATERYEAAGQSFAYRHFREDQPDNPFAGTLDHARWLPLEELKRALELAGFPRIEVDHVRQERNGLRTLLFARRA